MILTVFFARSEILGYNNNNDIYLQGCEEYEALVAAKAKILDFVETRMNSMAPNMCALIGSRITAQLLALTGGLTAMSKTPSCNLQVMFLLCFFLCLYRSVLLV